MPSNASSQSEAGKNGLKRINTNLSEVNNPAPRSSGTGSGRLSLHIPNAYPRALSPRSGNSRNVTPESSRPVSPANIGADGANQRASGESVFGALKGAPDQSNGESETRRSSSSSAVSGSRSRSSSRAPRVRVFRRDSSLITIHQIDEDDSPSSPPIPDSPEVQLRPTTLIAHLLLPFQKGASFLLNKRNLLRISKRLPRPRAKLFRLAPPLLSPSHLICLSHPPTSITRYSTCNITSRPQT